MTRKSILTSSQPVRTALALLTLSLTLATGCHKKNNAINPNALGPTNTAPAPTATLSADPLAVDLGQSVVLNWHTTDATTVTIDGIGQVNVNGTQTVTPSTSTNFHLTATGAGGSTDANVRVTVRVPTEPQGTTYGSGNNANGNLPTDAEFHAAVPDAFFDYDSYDLRPDAQAAVSQAAAYLVQHPNIHVLIGGYCDERGSEEYNLALGENRANAAKQGLVQAGVASNRIRVVSYGKEKQFCTQATESCYQENRRAQFTVDR